MDRRLICVLALLFVGCEDETTGGTGDAGERGQIIDALLPDVLPDVMGAPCRLNSDCDPGFYCHPERGCAFDCRVDRDCPSGTQCESGECNAPPIPVDAAPPQCRGDEQCMPPHTICVREVCVSGCLARGCEDAAECDEETGRCLTRCDPACPAGTRCDAETGTCEEERSPCRDIDCPPGQACNDAGQCVSESAPCRDIDCPPGQGCDANDRCVPLPEDCRRDGCPGGQVCDDETGECGEAPMAGILGSDCERAAECETGLCIDVQIADQRATVCSKPCCGEADCPIGFGCLYLGGLRLCLPSRIYPPGYAFDASVNQSCGIGGNACRSGLCDVRADRCLGACCTDGDCRAGEACRWLTAGNSIRATCELPLLGDGRTGSPCSSELECRSGVCIPVPVPNTGLPGRCADMCCTHRDCPGGTGCGQVQAFDGTLTSACVPLTPGPGADDARCGVGDACESGLCADGACRQPCCRDTDCPNERRCLPRNNGEGTLVRACVPQDD